MFNQIFLSNQSFFEDLAGIVRYHRMKSGLSRNELARLAAVGKTVIFDIEHAKRTVRLDTLIKILEALNITVELKSPLMQMYRKKINEKS